MNRVGIGQSSGHVGFFECCWLEALMSLAVMVIMYVCCQAVVVHVNPALKVARLDLMYRRRIT